MRLRETIVRFDSRRDDDSEEILDEQLGCPVDSYQTLEKPKERLEYAVYNPRETCAEAPEPVS